MSGPRRLPHDGVLVRLRKGWLCHHDGRHEGQGFVIDRIAPSLQAVVPGLDEARFQALAASAKRDCPLSKALASVPESSCSGTLRRWRCTRTPNWRRKAAEAAAAQGQFGPIASTLTRCRPP